MVNKAIIIAPKTTTAKIMAKMVNCEHLIDDNPCNECASCLSVNSGSDIIEIDAASNNGVDEIREIRDTREIREDKVGNILGGRIGFIATFAYICQIRVY